MTWVSLVLEVIALLLWVAVAHFHAKRMDLLSTRVDLVEQQARLNARRPVLWDFAESTFESVREKGDSNE